MTTRATDDPPPSDPRFDAAWRAVSSEAPPPALDAAILAAAHREVGARPQSISAQAAMRARRRWWPLAAAATVAVIAIGVVQRADREDLVAPPRGATVVSDIPAQSAKSVAESREHASEAPAGAARSESEPSASGGFAAGRARAGSVAPLQSNKAQLGSRADALQHSAPSATAALEKKALAVASAPAPVQNNLDASVSAPPPLPEPFPATKAKPEAAAARDATSSAPIADIAPESATLQRAEGGAAAAARQSPSAKSAMVGPPAQASVKDRAPLPVADWVALIRRLRIDGNVAEAARELAAFRAAHPEHEKLLPPDLRDWHPAENHPDAPTESVSPPVR